MRSSLALIARIRIMVVLENGNSIHMVRLGYTDACMRCKGDRCGS
jgi:hypothetical protein